MRPAQDIGIVPHITHISIVTNNLDVLSKAKDPFRLALPYVEML